jgi:cytochrome P450
MPDAAAGPHTPPLAGRPRDPVPTTIRPATREGDALTTTEVIGGSSPETDIYDNAQYGDGVPHEKLARLRRDAPVLWHELPDGGGCWYLLKHDDVARASADPTTFSAAKGGIVIEEQTPESLERNKTQLLSMDPPEHREMRNLVLTAFTPKAIDSMGDWLRERTRSIMAEAAAMGTCDFVMDVAGELPMQTINQMMDVPEEHRSRILTLADAVISGGGGRERGAASDPGVQLGQLGYELAAARKGKDGTDLISLMLKATYQGKPLDEIGFAGLFVQIAVAANETTRSMFAGALLALIENPDQWQALERDRSLLPTAVDEFLRWTTPVHYFRRTATRDVEVRGKTIREGDRVVLHYTSANFDDDVFDDPFRFDVRRSPNPHLAFGWGEHFCLGARLARLEGRIFFDELFNHFEAAEIVGPVERLKSNLTNTTKRIPIRLHPKR